MVKFKKYVVLLQILTIVVNSCVATETSSSDEKNLAEIAKPLKDSFEKVDGIPDSPELSDSLERTLRYLNKHCTKTGISTEDSNECDTYVPIAYYTYSVLLSRGTAFGESITNYDAMVKVHRLSPKFVFGKFYEHHMQSGHTTGLKQGIYLATNDMFKKAIEDGHLLKLLKLLADRIDDSSIMTGENKIVKKLVETFLQFYDINTRLDHTVQSLDASFEESRNVEMASDKLDEHLKVVNSETAEQEIKNNHIVFAFFAKRLIDLCSTKLKIQSSISDSNMKAINAKLLMIIVYYHAWSNGFGEHMWTLFHWQLVHGSSTEYPLHEHMNLFTNTKVLSSFHKRIKLYPGYKNNNMNILNYLLGVVFMKAHLKIHSMEEILTSDANENYRYVLSDVRHLLIALQMHLKEKKGGMKPVDRLPFPDRIKDKAIKADREYFRRLDQHMSNLSLKLINDKELRLELYTGLLKMHSVMEDRHGQDITQKEFDIMMKWHIKLGYSTDASVDNVVLKSLKDKLIKKHTQLNGNFVTRLSGLYGGMFNQGHVNVGIRITWKDLVMIHGAEDNFYKKIGIFILPENAEHGLHDNIIDKEIDEIKNHLKDEKNMANKHDSLKNILKVVIACPQIFQDVDLWTILKFFMEYSAAVPHIPKDIHDLIQIFFNQIFILKAENWDTFCNDDPSLLEYIRGIHEKLSKKLKNNLETLPRDDDIKRTNAILVKLCLMTFYNSMRVISNRRNYQQAQREHYSNRNPPIPNDIIKWEHRAQAQIMEHLFKIFEGDYAIFELNDDFANELGRFFCESIDLDGHNDEITEILQRWRFIDAITRMMGRSFDGIDKSLLQNLYIFLLLNYNRRSVVRVNQVLQITPIATIENIKHLLQMRHILGSHIKSDSQIFKIEETFFAIYSDGIANVISESTIYPGDAIASVQLNFAVDMMQRFLDAFAMQNPYDIAESTYLELIFKINFGSSGKVRSPKISEYMKATLVAADYFTQIIASYRAYAGNSANEPIANNQALLLQRIIPQFIKQIRICVPDVEVLLESRTFKNLSQVHDFWSKSKNFALEIFSHIKNWLFKQ